MEAIFTCPHPIPLPKGERVRSSDEVSSRTNLVNPRIVGPSFLPGVRVIESLLRLAVKSENSLAQVEKSTGSQAMTGE